jgi:glycosyltransferase involved in cell wall biosynthesis
MTYKVSIIVPIYKVEKYLKRCVDSLLNQSYTNLEIILVDDGSPDASGHIIDKYANLDTRVMAFHKENGGLSDARNYGMQYVTGHFTVFVDSDDWLDSNFISKLVNESLKYGADVVQSGFYYAYKDYLLYDDRFYSEDDPPLLFDNMTLMKELVINERVKNFAWGKLYKTELIRNLPFKKGVLFEDVFWAHQVMHHVQRYVILNEPMYYYFQREGSIVSSYTPKNLDLISGLKERHNFLIENYKELVDESFKSILKACLSHHVLLVINKDIDKEGKYRKDIQSYIKKNYTAFKVAVIRERHLVNQLLLFKINPNLNILYIFLGRVLRKLRLVPTPIRLKRIDL